MTAEAVWRDLYCHILLKSNLSWDFLFLCVYGEVSECSHTGQGYISPESIFSLLPSAPVCLADR